MKKILAQDPSGAHIYVYEGDESNPVFSIEVGGFLYSHSVRGFESPTGYEWYCSVMGRQFLELHDRSVYEGRNEVQSLIKKALEM